MQDARLVIHDLGVAGVTAASSPGVTASPCVSYQATLSTDPEACVTSIAWHPEHANLLYASVGSSIVCVDSRVADPVSVLSVNKDEINQVGGGTVGVSDKLLIKSSHAHHYWCEKPVHDIALSGHVDPDANRKHPRHKTSRAYSASL